MEAMRVLGDELPNIEVSISCAGRLRGKLDLAFMRPEAQAPDLECRVVAMPSDHRLASHDTIALRDIAGETFIGTLNTGPALRKVIEEYLEHRPAGACPRPLKWSDPPIWIVRRNP